VIGVGRSPERCRETENLLRSANPAADVAFFTGDLALQGQVRSLADQIRDHLQSRGKTGLDGLVNNAGTFTYWLTLTAEGYETQWAVNHLAPFLLTMELMPLLQAAPAARVVTVSSESHVGVSLNWQDIQLRRRYDGLRAYSQTKLANILFTLELNRLLGAQSRVRAFAADPGLVKTDIGFKGTPALVRWIWERRRAGGVEPEVPAEGITYLLGAPALQDSHEVYWKLATRDAKCAAQKSSRQARDVSAAQRLWSLSKKMCGIGWEVGYVQA
jgi:NAD(P)-dependent dehydrogenase (short-subunit alcohol dehydrogenase family)